MNKINIFVSSTCYDLSQIRTDLYESISNLGFTPVLSEFSNFPINPSSNTVENCIEVVNSSADIFVLILGNRYGYKLDSGKSITNMEFMAAKTKNIPTYVFMSKQLINLLPVYLNNKEADYSNVVDNTEIFEFANEIRNNAGLWSFEFEKFQDILNVLKIQLSYLFKESLTLRNKFFNNPSYDFHSKLSSKALKIIMLKERTFEHEFLAQVLVDEISKKEELKNDYEYKIVLKNNKKLFDNSDFLAWSIERISGVEPYTRSLADIVNILIPKYLNEVGKPSDLKGLYYAANTYSRIYESFVNWSIETLSVSVEENQKVLRNTLAEMTSKLIEDVWAFPFEYQRMIIDIKQKLAKGEPTESANLNIKLQIDPSVMTRLTEALAIFRNSF